MNSLSTIPRFYPKNFGITVTEKKIATIYLLGQHIMQESLAFYENELFTFALKL